MKKKIAVTVALFLTLSVSACAQSGNEGAETSGNSSSPSHQVTNSDKSNPALESSSAPSESFADGKLVGPDFSIVISKHKIIPVGKKGNEYGKKPVIAFWYKITNTSGKEMTPMNFLYVFEAIQDNNPNAVNKLEVGGLPDDAHLESQMETIKKNGTVENSVAYELDDLKTPVDLVASFDLGSTEAGRTTYQVN